MLYCSVHAHALILLKHSESVYFQSTVSSCPGTEAGEKTFVQKLWDGLCRWMRAQFHSHCPSSMKRQITPFSWWVTVVSAVFPPTPKQGTGPSYGLGMGVWVLSAHMTHGACGLSTTVGAVSLRQVSIAHIHASLSNQTSFTRHKCRHASNASTQTTETGELVF